MDVNEQVEVLAPSATPVADFLAAPWPTTVRPFADERLSTLNALSQTLLRDSAVKRDPASVALAYWLRRANILRLKSRFAERHTSDQSLVLVPVGGIFHIAPANVDTLFVYSWALAYLCGNTSIVRVSAQKQPAMLRIMEHIGSLMNENEDLRQSNLFVTYPHRREITEAFSRWCQHRIIWGGDETISGLRPLALSPHASERVFGSKFSYAVIGAGALLQATDADRQRLAASFFNDMFWFDQMACSSPHIVFWVGAEAAVEQAIPLFNTLLAQEVEQRGYTTALADAVQRLSFAFDTASAHPVLVDLEQRGFLSIRALDHARVRKEVCGGGLLTHVQVDYVAQVAEAAQPEDQTITHYGLSDADLHELALTAGARGVDRLVPVGEALAFSPDWDGYDLIGDLVRRVVVRQ